MATGSRLQHELKQNKPFVSQGHEAAVALMRTADQIRRLVGSVVDVEGITPQQYNVLRILRGAGHAGLPTLEIAERMIEETPGITRLIDRLEQKKLVVRERCLSDRRQVFCLITTDGIAMLERLDAPVQSRDDNVFNKLSSEQLDQLIGLLDRVRDGIEHPESVLTPIRSTSRSSSKKKENAS